MSKKKTYYHNECPFPGSRELVPFQHMGIKCMIPRKCSLCQYHEEGECRLLTNPLKRLDYDYCGIEGDTYIVMLEGVSSPVPAKCEHCRFLFRRSKELVWCNKDKPPEFKMVRGLDYGDRELAS